MATINLPVRKTGYPALLASIRGRIHAAQVRATFAANTELIQLYWDIGRVLVKRQAREGWGAGILSRLASDLHRDLPEVKGFSERNLKLMTQFFREYPEAGLIGQPTVAQLTPDEKTGKGQLPVAQLPWAHNVLLMQKVKDRAQRFWYMRKSLEQGWSRNTLSLMIEERAHLRMGKAITNFPARLPPAQSDLAQQTIKDPYLFDFLTLTEPFQERELETGLVRHLQKFLMELGRNFAFVGRQYRLAVGNEDYYLDLLFYHLELRCFIVIELKKGAFKAEYAGKMNFYLNVVDDQLRHQGDHSSIGLILCQKKNRLVAEYALKGVDKAIGVSEYQLTRALPKELRSSLPSIAEIERELSSPLSRKPW